MVAICVPPTMHLEDFKRGKLGGECLGLDSAIWGAGGLIVDELVVYLIVILPLSGEGVDC